jgi:hypothetical protein
MKKIIILLAAIVLFSFTDNSVKLKKDKIDQCQQILKVVYDYIDKSNLPHQDVLQLENSLKQISFNLSDTAK